MQNNNKINNKNKKKIINKINLRRKRPQRRRRRRIMQRRNIAAAYTRGFRKNFQILSQTGNTMRVRGRDLIYQIPDDLTRIAPSSLMTVIPCNPAYWLGTRMSAIAAGYQNYRPLKFKVTYVPQCAVTQQGNVLAGTLWAMAPDSENLQQTLRTSNGAMMTQCYKSGVSNVQLRRNLQYNLFRMGGKFDQESNPFLYIAMTIATVDSNGNKITPGYFYVNYEYELKNPIGNTIKYFNSNLIQYQQLNPNFKNITIINCSSTAVNPGAIIQIDDDTAYYNETQVELEDTDYIWEFSNESLAPTVKAKNKEYLHYFYKETFVVYQSLVFPTGEIWAIQNNTTNTTTVIRSIGDMADGETIQIAGGNTLYKMDETVITLNGKVATIALVPSNSQRIQYLHSILRTDLYDFQWVPTNKFIPTTDDEADEQPSEEPDDGKSFKVINNPENKYKDKIINDDNADKAEFQSDDDDQFVQSARSHNSYYDNLEDELDEEQEEQVQVVQQPLFTEQRTGVEPSENIFKAIPETNIVWPKQTSQNVINEKPEQEEDGKIKVDLTLEKYKKKTNKKTKKKKKKPNKNDYETTKHINRHNDPSDDDDDGGYNDYDYAIESEGERY